MTTHGHKNSTCVSSKKAAYLKYINSVKWKDISARLRLDIGKCQICGNTHNLQVHHINYDYLFNEEENLDTLIVLCCLCHKAAHRRVKNPKPKKKPKKDKPVKQKRQKRVVPQVMSFDVLMVKLGWGRDRVGIGNTQENHTCTRN